MGRPTLYTDELGEKICEHIATTPRGLWHICEDNDDLPCEKTIYNWLEINPVFLQRYMRARERQASLLMYQALDIADDGTRDTKIVGKQGEEREVMDSEWVARSNLRVKTRIILAERLDPKTWAARQAGQSSDTDTGKVPVYNSPSQSADTTTEGDD